MKDKNSTNSRGYVKFMATPGSYTVTAVKGNNEYLPVKRDIVIGNDGKVREISLMLEELVVPSGIHTIVTGAVVDCKNLTTVIISKGVMNIEESAFSGCSPNLKFKVYAGSAAEEYFKSAGIDYETIVEETIRVSENAEITCDGVMDIRDLVRLKKIIANAPIPEGQEKIVFDY